MLKEKKKIQLLEGSGSLSSVNQDFSLNIQITRIITTFEIGRFVPETLKEKFRHFSHSSNMQI